MIGVLLSIHHHPPWLLCLFFASSNLALIPCWNQMLTIFRVTYFIKCLNVYTKVMKLHMCNLFNHLICIAFLILIMSVLTFKLDHSHDNLYIRFTNTNYLLLTLKLPITSIWCLHGHCVKFNLGSYDCILGMGGHGEDVSFFKDASCESWPSPNP